MRTPSLWPALFGSALLHGLLLLAGWYFAANMASRPSRLCASLVESSNRLQLSVVFGTDGLARRSKPIDTKAEEQPSNDAAVKLDEAPLFNPPREVSPTAVAVQNGHQGPAVAGTNQSSGGASGAARQGGATLFEVGAAGHSVVYVLDRSASMGMNHAFSRARNEVLASLRRLAPDMQVQVLAYNHLEPQSLVGPERLLPIQPVLVAQLEQALAALQPWGKTDHVAALRRALFLHPDVIYFITDADDLTLNDVRNVSQVNQGRTAIHVIEMASRRMPSNEGPLSQLASNNRGTYRRIGPMQ